mmetsp:Transcript_4860/g.9922  ORF Transcript_4860/g.9922 Transcript_4860/m.9922 type:complete len:168 (+) Transcript_4860:148-651(+)
MVGTMGMLSGQAESFQASWPPAQNVSAWPGAAGGCIVDESLGCSVGSGALEQAASLATCKSPPPRRPAPLADLHARETMASEVVLGATLACDGKNAAPASESGLREAVVVPRDCQAVWIPVELDQDEVVDAQEPRLVRDTYCSLSFPWKMHLPTGEPMKKQLPTWEL